MRRIDEEDYSLSKISLESMEETSLPVRRKGVVYAHVLWRPSQKENNVCEVFEIESTYLVSTPFRLTGNEVSSLDSNEIFDNE